MKYIPKPIDTSKIALPLEIVELTELLSKNVHEVWSAQKMLDGFSSLDEKAQSEKVHSNLVPYEALSEGAKQYDRNTALETIKVLIKLGFKIEK